MEETVQIKNTPNEPTDRGSLKPELSSPTAIITKAIDRRPFLDTIESKLFAIIKIFGLTLLLLTIIFIFLKIYTQEATVILPFEISGDETLSGVAIADRLTAELIRIQHIHEIKYETLTTRMSSIEFASTFPTERSLGANEMVTPKATTVEFSIGDIGNIDIGTNSLSLGKLIIAFKNICPGSKPVATIRGSLQRYGSTIVLVALLESGNVKSWMVRQPVDANNEAQLHEMVRNLAFMIAHDLQQSDVSAKTWEGLKYYTEALDAYQQYKTSGNTDFLSLSSNYSLEAIKSEKGYKNPFDLLLSLETTYIMIGQKNDAVKYCNKTIELDPESAYSWCNKGSILNKLRKYSEAIQAYDKALEIDPQQVHPWNNKGLALHNLGKYDEAINAYDKAIELDPKYVYAWNNKGNALRMQGKYDEAMQTYDKAIELDPEYTQPWANKGNALSDQGKYDGALRAYNMSLEIDPQCIDAWNGKGWIFYIQDKQSEAIQAFDRAIEINPEYADAWANKGYVLCDQGKYDEAIQAYDKALEIDPQQAYPWANKGLALHNLGKYDEAINAYDKAIELDRRFAKAWNNKGMALIELGKYNESLEIANKALEIDPQSDAIWDTVGVALFYLGRFDEALKAYDEAIKINPNHYEVWLHRGEALKSSGRTKEADAAFAKAKELGYNG